MHCCGFQGGGRFRALLDCTAKAFWVVRHRLSGSKRESSDRESSACKVWGFKLWGSRLTLGVGRKCACCPCNVYLHVHHLQMRQSASMSLNFPIVPGIYFSKKASSVGLGWMGFSSQRSHIYGEKHPKKWTRVLGTFY